MLQETFYHFFAVNSYSVLRQKLTLPKCGLDMASLSPQTVLHDPAIKMRERESSDRFKDSRKFGNNTLKCYLTRRSLPTDSPSQRRLHDVVADTVIRTDQRPSSRLASIELVEGGRLAYFEKINIRIQRKHGDLQWINGYYRLGVAKTCGSLIQRS